MTSKPQPDKLGRNMKALPSTMWNRAIPENDYIQLGTLRYGVRLSNAGLLDGGKPGHVTDVPEGHSRASINSYEIPNGGDNSVHSVAGTTSSISSNGDKQNCCCIGSSGVEMPWTTSYTRTKLPVPSSVATPFGQRRRVLQPPSSLPVVKSYSFHRVPADAIGYSSPPVASRSPAGQLFDGAALSSPGRNRSFRNANHSRRLQYGCLDEPIGAEHRNGLAGGEPAGSYLRANVTRKSSLPVLSSGGISAATSNGRYPNLPAGGRASTVDECYPFDKSSCQPECVLTPRSHRKHPCSDAINEIRLQSLNKYCNQLLSATGVTRAVTAAPSNTDANQWTPTHGRARPARSIDELEDLSFIDSSDLSSAGDDINFGAALYGTDHADYASYGRECRKQQQRKQRPSIITGGGGGAGTAGDEDGTVPVVDGGRALAAATSTFAVAAGGGVGVVADGGETNRNNYIDSSSDELNSVCSGVEQLALACGGGGAESHRRNSDQRWQSQQPVVVKYRTQCTRNDSNASDDHQAARYCAELRIMEKRNNTLDRLQRLVKKTTSSSSDKQSSGGAGGSGNVGASGTTKTERLRELTELLKGNRAPPVPPPRRAKHAHSVERTFDRQNTALSTSSLNDTSFLRGTDTGIPESQLAKAKESRSVDIPYRFADGSGQRMSTPSSPLTEHKPVNLRANVSASNLEALHVLPPVTATVAEECRSETALKDDDELFAKLSRPESRTIVGSYTQKTIPFRSASFSQVDYSSGKYIRSALGALKNSILKSKDQQQSSVDSNTIPRQSSKSIETARSCSPTELCGSPLDREPQLHQPDETDVAKLTIKKTELSINLAPLDDYGRYYDERIDGKDLTSNRNSDIETIVEDPVAEHNENVENEGSCIPQQANISVMQASEMVLESLVEEGIPITPTSLSKDDECLQQATTCLIPVPVYDCVVSEWSTARPSEQWIDASTTEYGKFSDCLGSIKEVNESAINDMPAPSDAPVVEAAEESFHAEKITVENPPEIIEPQDSVELSEDGTGSDPAEASEGGNALMMMCTPPVSIICTEPESNEFTTIVDGSGSTHKVSVVLGDGNEVEVVEVRKRHSNNEDTGDPQNCRLSNDVDEKRRLESRKSRRKGIYIQWPAIDGNNELESDNNDNSAALGDDANVSWNPENLGHVNEKDSSLDLSGESFTDLSGKEAVEYAKERAHAVHSPDRYLLDPTTPDSDPGKPIWPKGNRRQSLTYQSSDEKDDTVPAPALPVRTLKTLLLRSESVSDNESDRASSRDRTSASPAPGAGDSDLRRYSKRPLRGPYGQMLEAEMKKPTTKVQYNEILEELTRNEERHGSNQSVSRNRGAGSQSMDETNDRHAAKAGSKPRKTSANLPVPTHVRTASSPSKLSDSSGSHSASPSKRYLCNIEQRSTDSDKSEKSNVGGGKLESKKFSLDSHHLADKALKRGNSEAHEKPSKQRSGSSASEKQQKRSLEEVRLSQNSRTPSERSFTLLNTPETPKGLAASPELLAELLKGSSEKLVTEQLTGSGGNSAGNGSNALPSAVLNCLCLARFLNSRLATTVVAMMPLNFCSDSEDDPERTPKSTSENTMWHNVISCYNDTRTHVVVELFNTEKSYVESLQTIVLKYLNQLKSPENSGLVDVQTVDEIFFMVPAILNIHERFLEELRRRLDSWDKMQMIGDAFVDVFSRPVILDTYTSFVNNWNRAKDAIRSARQKCPAFARFLEAMAREHKGKLSLDNLLIKPVQKFPKYVPIVPCSVLHVLANTNANFPHRFSYELIFTRLIKHTDVAHPDQKPLQEALKLVHDILMFLNCKEKEALENGQRETALRELEGVIEGMNDLVTPERAFLLFDLVSMPSGQVTRKERGFFLFNDLLVITSIKRRSGTIRKTNMTCPGSVASTLDTNKYKYLTKISLDDLEIVKCKYGGAGFG
uniref:DH domain-containing protein n=1 Tax=Anopheles dirus TaxID=7168 RepID=A0A182NFZ3_9DIPT